MRVPPNAEPPRHTARYFALLCDVLNARGIDSEALLGSAGLSAPEIHAPDSTLSIAQFDAFVVAGLQRRPDLAFVLGRTVKLSSHDILGFGILTSPTLDYAMALTARYYRLISPWMLLRYHRGVRTSELTFQPGVELPPASLQFLLEVAVVATHVQMRSQVSLAPYDVYVSYSEPAYATRYRELAPARIHFAAEALPSARLVMDSAVFRQPLPMADRTSLKMAEARCEEQYRRTAQATGVTPWVTMMLREAAAGLPSRAELARLINQSPRTLDRQLRKEGSSFLALSKRIRHDRARQLLRQGLSATQVAFEVGYRDVANFTRAFRRECGQSPGEYARAHTTKV